MLLTALVCGLIGAGLGQLEGLPFVQRFYAELRASAARAALSPRRSDRE